ncbi:MAG: RNA methyltransferase [Bacteroidota bacterium]
MKKLKNEELNRLEIEDFKSSEKTPVIFVLDNIRSMNNVGSVFRTADAFRINSIFLCGITAKPPHREIHKTALGSTESVDWKYFENTLDAIDHLRHIGYQTIAIEQADKSTSLENFNPSTEKRYAFIFGNEVFGVEDEVLTKCSDVLEIPQFGTKHSLNISVSVGVVAWHYIMNTLRVKEA